MDIYKFAYFGKRYYCKDGKECFFCSFRQSGNDRLALLYRKDWGPFLTYLDGEAHSGYCVKEDWSIDPNKENEINEKEEGCCDVVDDSDGVLRSQPYTQIFDTKYYWNVPYLIDVENYKKEIKTEIPDGYTNILSLTSEIENGYKVVLAFSRKKKEKQGDLTSDCFQFHFDDLNKFKEFVRKITETFIGVDNISVFEKCIDMENQITEINRKKERLLNVSGNVNTCE